MKRSTFSDAVYPAAVAMAVMLLASTAAADTVAWWHFDEEAPGTVATSGVVTESISGTTATSYWIDSNSVKQTSSPYRPAFGPAFSGLAVYDPVAGTTNANRSAMKFVTARGGATPNTNAGRAYYGGAFKIDGGNSLYANCTGSVTIEAFVCTTGGVYNTFAPIIGCLAASSWTGEKWAIYMENNGTLAIRFNGSVWYSGNNYKGTATINDGRWHHIALTWDGSTVKVYVDYVLDKKTDNSDREYSKSGTIDYTGTATWMGGYGTYDPNNGGRKYPGLVDEVRISNVALTPGQFLRLVPTTEVNEDEDTILHVRFDSEARAIESSEAVDGAMCGAQAIFYAVSGAGTSTYDTAEKVAPAVATGIYDDAPVADVSSFCQFTNAADKANFVKVPAVADYLFPDGVAGPTNLNYTIETFFKARGEGQIRKTLFKLGTDYLIAHVITGDDNNSHRVQFCYKKDNDHTWVGSGYSPSGKPYDDGNWHHVAFVSDASNSLIRTYYDYELVSKNSDVYVPVKKGYSLFIGSKENGDGQFFDGWIDDVRVTKRVLRPEEFLTTHPVGSATPKPLFFADFENNYNFTCDSNSYWSVTGSGLKNTSAGNVPTFEKTSPGALLLDGTNGSERVVNDYSVQLNKSYVEMPVSPLYEQRAFTVEFWAKFTGFIDNNGEHDGTYTNLPYHAGILRFNRDSSSEYDWFFYRIKDNAKGMQVAVRNAAGGMAYLGVFYFGRNIADGKWHHYAITFDTNEANTLTTVNVFDDYKQVVGNSQTSVGVYRYTGGHKLQMGMGSSNPPFTLGYINSLRFTRGVLTPDKFLGRVRRGTVVVFR